MIGAHSAGRGPAFDRVVDAAEMRALETQAPPGVNLMQNAGQAIAAAILRRTGSLGGRSVVVLVGPGDNGGDALIAAARLAATGARVTAWASRERPHDPLVAAATARGVRWRVWTGDPRPLTHDVRWATCLLDGLLGIGSSPPLRGPIADILAELPIAAGQTRVAIDIPSGIDADTGAADPAAFRAHLTLATGPVKLGALLHPAIEFAGRQIALDIGLPAAAYAPIKTALIDARTARRLLPPRPLDGHKGTFGRLAIVAGSVRYRGAAALATVAALRAGAGLVTLASVEPACATTAALAPAATFVPLSASPSGQVDAIAADVAASFARPTALLVGPGLGRSNAGDALVYGLLDKLPDTPKVIDADGLNALADRPDLLETLGPGIVLTPHPGELARLLRLPAPPEGRQRLSAAKNLAAQTRATSWPRARPRLFAQGRVDPRPTQPRPGRRGLRRRARRNHRLTVGAGSCSPGGRSTRRVAAQPGRVHRGRRRRPRRGHRADRERRADRRQRTASGTVTSGQRRRTVAASKAWRPRLPA